MNTAAGRGAAGDGASLVVINTSGKPYSGPCVAWIARGGALSAGLELIGPAGRLLPYEVVARDGERVTIRFAVRDVPAVGFNTYSLRPENSQANSTGELSPWPSYEPDTRPEVTAVQTGVHLGVLRPVHAFLSGGDLGVDLLSLRPLAWPGPSGNEEVSLDGGLLLRFREVGGKSRALSLAFNPAAEEAWLMDDFARKGNALHVTSGAWRQLARRDVGTGARGIGRSGRPLEAPRSTGRVWSGASRAERGVRPLLGTQRGRRTGGGSAARSVGGGPARTRRKHALSGLREQRYLGPRVRRRGATPCPGGVDLAAAPDPVPRGPRRPRSFRGDDYRAAGYRSLLPACGGPGTAIGWFATSCP